MSLVDKVLPFRPTNAVARLGQGSPLPLLNPRDLLKALRNRECAVLCVPVTARFALGGLFRAARDQDAVLGLSCPYVPGDRNGPYRFFQATREAGDETQHRRPFFLQGGPLRLAPNDAEALQPFTDTVFRFVDAGFSLLSVDASRLSLEANIRACAEITQLAVERELSIEVAAPQVGDGRTSADEVGAFLEGLKGKLCTLILWLVKQKFVTENKKLTNCSFIILPRKEKPFSV